MKEPTKEQIAFAEAADELMESMTDEDCALNTGIEIKGGTECDNGKAYEYRVRIWRTR